MTARSYTAKVSRDGKFWLIRIAGIGLTQARSVADIEPMARDLVATVLDTDEQDFAVTVTFADQWARMVNEADSKREKAARAKAEAAEAVTRAAQTLATNGVGVRDAAALLHISPAWAASLVSRKEGA